MKDYTVSILVRNDTGVLTRIFGLLLRRGYDIVSLAVGPSETVGVTRIIIVLFVNKLSIARLIKQLEKLHSVIYAEDSTSVPCIERELMLVKLRASSKTRREILEIAKIFHAEVVDFTKDSLTLEVTGDPGKIVLIEDILSNYDIKELAKSGKIILKRDSEVNTEYLRYAKNLPFFLPLDEEIDEDAELLDALERRAKRQEERDEELELIKAEIEEAEKN